MGVIQNRKLKKGSKLGMVSTAVISAVMKSGVQGHHCLLLSECEASLGYMSANLKKKKKKPKPNQTKTNIGQIIKNTLQRRERTRRCRQPPRDRK